MANLVSLILVLLCVFCINQIGIFVKAEVATSNNQLGTKLYSILSTKTKGDFGFSPLAMSSFLAMLNAGANDDMTQEIKSVSQFTGSSPSVLSNYKRIFADYNNFPATKSMIQRLFISRGLKYQPDFLDSIQFNFLVEPGYANFTNATSSATEINEFFANQTDDTVQTLISEQNSFSNETKSIFASSTVIQASWVHQFKIRDTKPSPFYYSQNRSNQVEMMFQSVDVPYAQIDELDCQAVTLPYRLSPGNRDSRLELIILLPNERMGLEELEKKLGSPSFSFAHVVNKFTEMTDLFMYLPKFEIPTVQLDFIDAFEQLGLKSPFTPGLANFSKMVIDDQAFTISRIYHYGNFTIDELGSSGHPGSAPVPGPPNRQYPPSFRVDHPFVAFVYDQKRHIILYIFRKVE